jgi:pyruvate/2-oxoglutarate dehydrogenase complex dihydrolipoamide acyltransferase (E2) component
VQAVRTTGNIQAAAAAAEAAPEAPTSDAAPEATDAAKALAAQHGIDLATVTGTGSDGRITKDDVQALVTPEPEPEPEAEPETGPGDNEPEQLEVG